MDKLTVMLYGNGQPGLATRLSLVERALQRGGRTLDELLRWALALATGLLLGLMDRL